MYVKMTKNGMKYGTYTNTEHNVRYVFFGTPAFATFLLAKLIEGGYVPLALVANPDRPVGRKKIVAAPPTKQFIIEKRLSAIRIFQPKQLDDEAEQALCALQPDIFVVAAYGHIVPKKFLAIPRLGTIGVHPSLLPHHRGPSPIQATILDGDKEAGISLYIMDEKVDHGPVIAHAALHGYDPETANYERLEKELAALAGDLLVKTIPAYHDGRVKRGPQDERLATYTKKFKTEDGFVEPEALRKAIQGSRPDAERIDRVVRALYLEPGCWTIWNGKRMKILRASIEDGKLVPTEIQFAGEKSRSGESLVTSH